MLMVFALFLVFVSILYIFVFFNRSPITLEYAEELLLMADTGRCAVLDVSEVAKERPTGFKMIMVMITMMMMMMVMVMVMALSILDVSEVTKERPAGVR